MKTLKTNDASNVSSVRLEPFSDGKFSLLIERTDTSSSWVVMEQGLPIHLPPGISALESDIVKSCVLDSDNLVNIDETTKEKLCTQFRIKAMASFFSRELIANMSEEQLLSAFRIFRVSSVQGS